jgi:cytochrome c556
MRKTYVLSIAITLLAAGVLAQGDSEYQGWMKSNAANMGSLNKNLAAKNGAGAASDAQKLEATFMQVADFWNKRGGADDALGFAMRAEAAAAAVAKAATAGNWDEAGAQLKNLQATCGGCHMTHREGSPGSFKIK